MASLPYPSASFVAESDKAWSLRERRLACPAPKARSQRSSPRFRPAQVSQRCCHARIHHRRPEGGSRSAAKDPRELRLGPMRSGYLCPLGSGPGDHEIPQLHQAIARAGALLSGRRQSDGGEHGPPVARLQLPARQRRPALGDFHAERPGSFCQDARSDAGFPCGAHSGTGRQAGLEEGRGILRQQSRNAASGGLHRRASVAGKLCRHDLLGRARISRDEFKRRDTVHQVQGHAGRRRRQAGRERGHGEASRPPARRPRLPDRGPRYQVQRDGAARPSRRPRHGCHHPMARRGRARSFAAGNDRGHRRRSKRCVRRGRLQSGQSCRRHRSSAGRDVCGALRRLRDLSQSASTSASTLRIIADQSFRFPVRPAFRGATPPG